jgi:hypothetical protein
MVHDEHCSSYEGISLWTVSNAVAGIISIRCLFSVTVSEECVPVLVQYTLEQRVFLHDTYFKYRSTSTRKCRRKFRDERVPSSQTFH